MKSKQAPKLTINQDGKVYDLYNLPKDFVIKGSLDLSGKGLTALPNLSEVIVMGDFYCYSNNLVSLEGAPKEVKGGFYCHFNKLISLKGAPRKVGEWFNFRSNNVYSFQYLPMLCSGQFWFCDDNPLKVDENVPKHVLKNIDQLCGITESVRTKLIKKYRMLTK
ncbi:MAG: hypothetical protein MJ158_02870 [Alphaproteobacteria bacterium]|nr:hypothetical protein [Alphaproteobacteria bacterium]